MHMLLSKEKAFHETLVGIRESKKISNHKILSSVLWLFVSIWSVNSSVTVFLQFSLVSLLLFILYIETMLIDA